MKKIYIIIVEDAIVFPEIMSFISKLGTTYPLYNNQVLLLCDICNAKEVYDQIELQNFSGKRLVVFEISSAELAYWGFSDKSLWEWLKNVYSEIKQN